MAGIQLTGSVESLPEAMSGAMSTAAVEEINVPVFIDEYQQQSSYLTPTSNGDDHSKNNILYQRSENDDLHIEDSIGNCIDSNLFGNFEFDLGFITDDNTNSGDNLSMQQEQQKNITMGNYCNNSNIFDDLSMFEIQSRTINSQTVDNIEIKDENEENMELIGNPFDILQHDSEEALTEDFTTCNSSMSIDCLTEKAIDIIPYVAENDLLNLSQIMIHSQNNPMLNGTVTFNSQTILNAEPIVPDIHADVISTENISHDFIKLEDTDNFDGDYKYFQTSIGSVKRMNTSASSDETMYEKRSKLHLETSLSSHCDIKEGLNTPGVVDLIYEMNPGQNDFMPFKKKSEIYTELISNSNSSFLSAKAETATNTPFTTASCDENYESNFGSPSTPQSSISLPYTYIPSTFTSPNSPALSTTSTITRVDSKHKSRRGRPPKEHSDRPDPSKLSQLSESERKRAEDRAKNNEASRLSRLKNKEREEAEILEENKLIKRNSALNKIYNRLASKEQKLKHIMQDFYKNKQSQ